MPPDQLEIFQKIENMPSSLKSLTQERERKHSVLETLQRAITFVEEETKKGYNPEEVVVLIQCGRRDAPDDAFSTTKTNYLTRAQILWRLEVARLDLMIRKED